MAELHRATKISKDSVLLAFGGAGPLNACGVAEVAGITQVAVPRMAAVFSAYGIGTCDISQRYTEALARHDQSGLEDALAVLQAKAGRDMYAEGFDKGQYEIEARLVATDAQGNETSQPLTTTPVFPAGMTGAATVELELAAIKRLRADTGTTTRVSMGAAATAGSVRNILARGRGRIDVPVYRLAALKPGDHAVGPAIVEEDYFTCRVLEGWTFVISDAGDILLNRKA
ncbi:MAG: hypothetical protein K2X42_09035 [Burkholderiaceae bacterium]|nr:hypothetical protein [Burkholderiaceae bacterium]